MANTKALLVLSGMMIAATGCGSSFFAESSKKTSEGIGNLTDGTTPAGDAQSKGGVSADITTTTKAADGTSDKLNGDLASKSLEKRPGWSLSCGGNLFSSVFPGAANEKEEEGRKELGLLGWSAANAGGAGSAGTDKADIGALFLGKLDECVDVDLKAAAEKGNQYVVVKFDKSSKAVLESKLFDSENFGKVNPADYNKCAQIAGTVAARVQEPSIASLVTSSGLEGHASCGAEACCIKFN
jgi:hypothetical protein